MSEFKRGDKVKVTTKTEYIANGIYTFCGYSINDGYCYLEGGDGIEAALIQNIQAIPDPYADYDGGKPQYLADVATLTEAGLLAGQATAGEWQLNEGDGSIFVKTPPQNPDDAPNYGAIIEGAAEGAVWYSSLADAQLILNAARVGHALSRFMPWALARLEAKS